jgi:hypothetical protein
MSALNDILAKPVEQITVLDWAVILHTTPEKAEQAAAELTALRARLTAAEQERDGLLGVLRDITPDGWMQNESGDYCLVCDGVAGKHEADCKLAAALKGA